MNYQDKLKDPRWQRRRLEIFARDNWTCRNCNNTERSLVVHHICYFPKMEPWEYPDQYLLTLCDPCHEKNDVKPLAGIMNSILFTSILNERRRTLESSLEQNYNTEQSRQLDCIIYLLNI